MSNDRTFGYRRAISRACEFPWPGDLNWNAIFLDNLAGVGLRLIPWDTPLRPPSHLVYAPMPVPDGPGPHWPMSLMVLANDLPWFYRYAVGDLARITDTHPTQVVPWVTRLCTPLQTTYTDLFADVLATYSQRRAAFGMFPKGITGPA